MDVIYSCVQIVRDILKITEITFLFIRHRNNEMERPNIVARPPVAPGLPGIASQHMDITLAYNYYADERDRACWA